MRIIVKAKNFKIPTDLESYIREKLLKFEKMTEEPTVCEVRLEERRGAKRGVDKIVHIYLTLPKVKNPIYLMEATNDWFGSIDLIEEKFEKEILKYKEKVKIGSRYPKKYFEAKLEEEAEGEI